jgi:ABC-type multidrug transport system fused ATPase/permease subunit
VLNVLIYKKAMLLTNDARASATQGEIVNYMSNDSQKFMEFAPWTNVLIMSPIWVVAALAQLYYLMGLASLSGTVVLMVTLRVNLKLTKKLASLRREQLADTDLRVKLTNEALLGIRVLKYNAWEAPTVNRIKEIRAREITRIRFQEWVNAANRFIMFASPILVGVVTFVTYSLLTEDGMDAGSVFAALMLFNVLRMYMAMMPRAFSTVAQQQISEKRIATFLQADEFEVPQGTQRTDDPAPDGFGHIMIRGGEFGWAKDAPSALSKVNFTASGGKLVAVVGAVGSGKSSLLSAIIGEMETKAGKVECFGSIAFCAQQPWILSGTVRDNITFGLPMDKEKYNHAIRSCSMLSDLDLMTAGDMTEIGEKGINISGGQKARIALARAVYRDADIILMDDVLAAVDVHVGEELLSAAICGALARKTRVLVTNQLHVLPRTDHIIVLGEGGEIAEEGTYEQLMANQSGELAALVATHEGGSHDVVVEAVEEETSDALGSPFTVLDKKPSNQEDAGDKRGADDQTHSGDTPRASEDVTAHGDFKSGRTGRENAAAKGKLVEDEERKQGRVEMSVVLRYLYAGSSPAVLVLMVFAFIAGQSLAAAADYWLALWTAQPRGDSFWYYEIGKTLIAASRSISSLTVL